jgi:hypothetical protein
MENDGSSKLPLERRRRRERGLKRESEGRKMEEIFGNKQKKKKKQGLYKSKGGNE